VSKNVPCTDARFVGLADSQDGPEVRAIPDGSKVWMRIPVMAIDRIPEGYVRSHGMDGPQIA